MMCSAGTSWAAFNLIVLLWGRAAGIETCDEGAAFSVPGPVVPLGTNVTVYCTFKKSTHRCRTAIYQDSNEIRDRRQYNSSTIYLKIANLKKHKVSFACKTECISFSRLICGIDIKAGYPPESPQNLTCTQNGQRGDVTCTWDKGREPHIKTSFHLRVKNKTHDLNGICDDPSSGSVSFHKLNAESLYTVWVTSSNALGNASSPPLNITLSDIVKPSPPVITLFNCASSDCTLYWEAAQNCQLLEVRVQPLGQNAWKHHTLNVTVNRFTLPGLQPFTDYQFQARCKLSRTKGMWSEWSEPVTNRTPEAVPTKELDVWFVMETPDPNSITLVWKKLSQSEARGQILGYKVTSPLPCKNKIPAVLPDSQNHLTMASSRCILTLSAYNSRGSSPPTNISIPFQTGFPAPGNVTCMPHSNDSVVVRWRPPVNKGLALRGYVVEWSPHQEKLDLGWTRLHHEKLSTVISGPTDASHTNYTINGLKSGATYLAWVTASAAAGEGPKQEFELTVNPEENPLVLSLTGVALIFILALVCISCNSAVSQRMTLLCSRFLPQWYTGHVPDPANCKWAQEYAAIKGQRKLVYDLHLSDSLSSCDEPDTLEVEEVSEESDSAPEDLVNDNGMCASAEEKQAGKTTMLPWCRLEDLAIYKHQLPCAYIQSMSLESDTNVQTPESCNTEITVDYIPSNVLHMGSSEEETSDFFDDFAPSFPRSPFSKPKGTLTLDAVKIDCSSLLD
ncbi:interleukin-12 receptor subunit beta-2-like [Polyodon spathula]|uniref:interleukin-12 receptor subunit beta-2-like n=1 Tax=Polyodon spathula TaxID=7913 RepID=UPI001B7E38C6|nr:interleukin-12 receptor subunit beta-2-like [Polyodon spathula]